MQSKKVIDLKQLVQNSRLKQVFGCRLVPKADEYNAL